MRKDLADITVVMDRSGSMASCLEEAVQGLNHFVDEQKGGPGQAAFTLVQFDTVYEFVHRAVPVRDVPRLTLVPRGMTALLDAVGRAVVETGERLRATAEPDRPGLVIFVILTDGQENSSHEFTKARVKEMIEHQARVYGWQFTFLGANQDAFAEAAAIGVPTSAAMNYVGASAGHAFAAASSNVGRMRGLLTSGGLVSNAYTDAERKAAVSPGEPDRMKGQSS